MGSHGPKRRTVLKWVFFAVVAIRLVVEFAANIATLWGYSLKDVTDADKANVVRQAVRVLGWPVPLWVVPASWLVLWPLLTLVLRDWQANRDEVAEADFEDSLAKVRLRSEIESDLRMSIEAREKHLRLDLEETKERETRTQEELREFRSSVTAQMGQIENAKVEAEVCLETTRMSLEQEQSRIRFAEIILKAIEVQASHVLHECYKDISKITDNFTEAYLARRSDWSTFTDNLVAGSIGGPEPSQREYVQRMVYYFGALMRSYDTALSETKSLGVMPKAAWESASGGSRINEEQFQLLADERLGINRDREIIRRLDSRMEEVQRTRDAE